MENAIIAAQPEYYLWIWENKAWQCHPIIAWHISVEKDGNSYVRHSMPITDCPHQWLGRGVWAIQRPADTLEFVTSTGEIFNALPTKWAMALESGTPPAADYNPQ